MFDNRLLSLKLPPVMKLNHLIQENTLGLTLYFLYILALSLLFKPDLGTLYSAQSPAHIVQDTSSTTHVSFKVHLVHHLALFKAPLALFKTLFIYSYFIFVVYPSPWHINDHVSLLLKALPSMHSTSLHPYHCSQHGVTWLESFAAQHHHHQMLI